MTLNDIIVSALAQLDRGHDAQTMDTWRDKFTRFANDAVLDLSDAYKPTTTQSVRLTKKTFAISELEKPCVRIYSITHDSIRMNFVKGPAAGNVTVTSADDDDVVSVTYRYAPHEMSAPSDEPELPVYMHGLVVCYVVARERAAGDTTTQRGANIYFQMYDAGRARIIPHIGDDEGFSIINRW